MRRPRKGAIYIHLSVDMSVDTYLKVNAFCSELSQHATNSAEGPSTSQLWRSSGPNHFFEIFAPSSGSVADKAKLNIKHALVYLIQ